MFYIFFSFTYRKLNKFIYKKEKKKPSHIDTLYTACYAFMRTDVDVEPTETNMMNMNKFFNSFVLDASELPFTSFSNCTYAIFQHSKNGFGHFVVARYFYQFKTRFPIFLWRAMTSQRHIYLNVNYVTHNRYVLCCMHVVCTYLNIACSLNVIQFCRYAYCCAKTNKHDCTVGFLKLFCIEGNVL